MISDYNTAIFVLRQFLKIKWLDVAREASGKYVQKATVSISVLVLVAGLLLPASAQKSSTTLRALRLLSPDSSLVVTLTQQETSGKRQISYQVHFKGKPVILESGLSIQIDNHLFEKAMAQRVDTLTDWCADLEIKNIIESARDTTWNPVYGERSSVRDRYNQLEIQLAKAGNPNYRLSLIVRAYDEGIAIRYFFPEHPQGLYYKVVAENTEFTLPAETKAYVAAWAQAAYEALPLRDWPDESERPLTLALPNGLYASLAEASMIDYSRTKFKLSQKKKNTITTSIYESVDLISPVGTPWRVIMVADKPGKLIENNAILLNLNEPSRIADPSWIKPGKVMRETTLTTKNALACIDFAQKHNLQYILFDWKWYGPAFSFNSDASKVVAPIDMAKVVSYGKNKGVGVWLYVNQQALLAQMDQIFPLYEKWGIKGVKFGFIQVGSHRWTSWTQHALKTAAKYNLMVNIHDEYRPTGEARTWPNFMTSEGIRGNEEFPDATQNTMLPFTRGLAGASDYTICYYDRRLKNTHAHQLALSVVMYSPIQTLFWYDRPGQYHGEPEIEFFEHVPTTWNETLVLNGEIGKYITTARRSGQQWFVGSITNNDARKLSLPLDFLSDGRKYTAHIYSDDPTVSTATKVAVERKLVDNQQTLELTLQGSGGQAIRFTPVK